MTQNPNHPAVRGAVARFVEAYTAARGVPPTTADILAYIERCDRRGDQGS